MSIQSVTRVRTITGARWLPGAWIGILERRLARQVCRDLLGVYEKVRAANANLAGEPLYEQVIARYNNSDAQQAKQLLNHAEESFARWPTVRNLSFRDVALYLILSETLTANRSVEESRTDVTDIVYSVIPAGL